MYFDPGVGSLIIQAVIASLAVIGGYFAIAKTKLKNLFGKGKNEDVATDADADKTEQDDADDAL